VGYNNNNYNYHYYCCLPTTTTACCHVQVVELLHGFLLYTEHLDSSTELKPDDDNKMWILDADRTPYPEGIISTASLTCIRCGYGFHINLG